jgi:soluble lytic murein transglycosylase-like protein
MNCLKRFRWAPYETWLLNQGGHPAHEQRVPMTRIVLHCYRHALRFARRVLRRQSCRLAMAWAPALALALAPVQVGISMARPMPELQAAEPVEAEKSAAVIQSSATEKDDALDSVAAALEDCPNALSAAQREHMARIICTESDRCGYDPLFITALIQVESGCAASARGNGAVGLVQMLPATARGVARRNGMPWRGERTLTEPASNIQLGVAYLLELEEQLGDSYRAIAAYNLGPARVAHMSSRRAERSPYVQRILERYEALLDQDA